MFKYIVIFAFFSLTSAVPVDNGVEGEPEIECGPTSITVNFNTQKSFEGHVYVLHQFNKSECRTDGNQQQVAGIELPFEKCNLVRSKSLNPSGVSVETTVVISFHPQFVTKVDRAYRVRCFYMAADKTVSTGISVSDLTTAFQTQTVPMPVCRYEILDRNSTGQPITHAIIGQPVYHKWTCDSETQDTFCAVVHNCVVDDLNGEKIEILNTEGCAVDKFLLGNLEYPTDLMAGKEAHVYKYADRSALYYECQISITIKEPNGQCPRPTCTEPTGFNAVVLNKSPNASSAGSNAASANRNLAQLRLLKKREINYDNTVDVHAELNALDIMDRDVSLPPSLRYRNTQNNYLNTVPVRVENAVCMSTYSLTVFIALGMAFVAGFVVIFAYVLRPQSKIH